jgi:hypothetical protein
MKKCFSFPITAFVNKVRFAYYDIVVLKVLKMPRAIDAVQKGPLCLK